MRGGLAVVAALGALSSGAGGAAAPALRADAMHDLGTDGNDVMRGTTGHDVIWGRNGDDAIVGLGGADRIVGGRGNDRIDGGHGADDLRGGRCRDFCVATDDGIGGNDVANGGPGRDVHHADAGDVLVGVETARSC